MGLFDASIFLFVSVSRLGKKRFLINKKIEKICLKKLLQLQQLVLE